MSGVALVPARRSFYPLARARGSPEITEIFVDGVWLLSPRAREGQLPRCAKRRSHNDPTAGNGMRCARRGRGRFVQTTENPAGSLHRRMCKTGFACRAPPEKACDVLEASRGSICTNDGAWCRVARSRERPCLAVQAHCKNPPSDAGKRCPSRARGVKNSPSGLKQPYRRFTLPVCHVKYLKLIPALGTESCLGNRLGLREIISATF
jgi:hypothetical protein